MIALSPTNPPMAPMPPMASRCQLSGFSEFSGRPVANGPLNPLNRIGAIRDIGGSVGGVA